MSEDHGKGHHPQGKALRYLFASGILKGTGSGKKRHVEYTKHLKGGGVANGAKSLKARVAVTGQAKPGGSSAARPDHSANRASRVAAGVRAAGRKLHDSAFAPRSSDRLKFADKFEAARRFKGVISPTARAKQDAISRAASDRAGRIIAGMRVQRAFAGTDRGRALEAEARAAGGVERFKALRRSKK